VERAEGPAPNVAAKHSNGPSGATIGLWIPRRGETCRREFESPPGYHPNAPILSPYKRDGGLARGPIWGGGHRIALAMRVGRASGGTAIGWEGLYGGGPLAPAELI